jgi:hypothetical protein
MTDTLNFVAGDFDMAHSVNDKTNSLGREMSIRIFEVARLLSFFFNMNQKYDRREPSTMLRIKCMLCSKRHVIKTPIMSSITSSSQSSPVPIEETMPKVDVLSIIDEALAIIDSDTCDDIDNRGNKISR